MNATTLNKASRYTIFGLSLFAMSLIVGATILALLGVLHPTEDNDEGVLAHLFQLAIVLLLPSGLVYLLSAD